MTNKQDWTLLLNPSYKKEITNNPDFDKFLKQVNYKDRVLIYYNGSWMEGEIRGFNHQRVYVFNEYNKMSEHEWQQLKLIKKQSNNDLEEFVYYEQKVNIIAVIFTIIIFIFTFIFGYIFSMIPELFVK
jgi:hypothetical protein